MSPTHRSKGSFARRRVALLVAAIALVGGCAQVLGLETWQDPIGGGGSGGAGGGGNASTNASTGGHVNVDPQNPTCADGVRNGLETDVDCGGDACPPCENGLRCQNDADCAGLGCVAGRCVTSDGGPCESGPDPTCHDCKKNGFETDVDCGGDSCLPCTVGKTCVLDFDCMSTRCRGGQCQPGATGQACRAAEDCVSGACDAGDCWSGLCCG